MTINDFIMKLRLLFRGIDILELGDGYDITIYEKQFKVKKTEIETIIEKYNAFKLDEYATIYSSNYYETTVEYYGVLLRSDTYDIYDEGKKTKFEVSEISNEYLLLILEFINEDNIRTIRRNTLNLSSGFLKNKIREIENFMDLIKLIFRRVVTIKIKSDNKYNLSKFKELSDSLLFNITLNTGISFIKIKHFDEIFGKRLPVNRRREAKDIEPPQRKYISDLVYYYQMGISTHDPSLKFISFYHVLEYFFNKVYYEDLVQLIRNDITSPRFSAKQDSDINKLIKNIKKKIRTDSESNDIRNEKEALKLVLKKYVNIEKIKFEIEEDGLISLDYYINKTVPFAKGDKINFYDNSEDKIYVSMANRIYKTRNAVIHSKLDEEDRYIPFKHEIQLYKEIPLIQGISEEIIIATSEIL